MPAFLPAFLVPGRTPARRPAWQAGGPLYEYKSIDRNSPYNSKTVSPGSRWNAAFFTQLIQPS